MAKIFVVLEQTENLVDKHVLEILTLARRFASVTLLVATELSEEIVEEFSNYGVETIYKLAEKQYQTHGGAVLAEFVAKFLAEQEVSAVFFSNTYLGKEIAARVSVLNKSGVITDVCQLESSFNEAENKLQFQAVKDVSAASALVYAQVTKGVPLFTLKPHICVAKKVEVVGEVEVVNVDFEVPGVAKQVSIVAKQNQQDGSLLRRVDTANIVVAGGRGVGGDFSLVESLAAHLGAAVGATRAAVDSGWISHTKQIGQTGHIVNPKLYVGVGISGAFLHKVGIENSKIIVAINKDPEAAIFEIADFGIVGDLFKVLPKIISQIKLRKQ